MRTCVDAMPRNARGDDWINMGIPTTPLQRGAYLDACTLWLTSEPVHGTSTEVILEHTEAAVMPPAAYRTGFAFSHAEGVCTACSVCSRMHETNKTVVANPFTQQCMISVCEACTKRTVPNETWKK